MSIMSFKRQLSINNFLNADHSNDTNEEICYTHCDVNAIKVSRSRCGQELPIFITLRFTNIVSKKMKHFPNKNKTNIPR
jgi:hypothetical protein